MKHAFSLIELSIVLVILGLVTGGILAGQSLIRAAELRSLTSDTLKYRVATLAFRDKYLAYPGDMQNATRFWGISAGTTGNDLSCYNSYSADVATCDGDGDGKIGIEQQTAWESFRFWQHLGNAGLIEGRYTGRGEIGTGGSQKVCILGSSCPQMHLSNVSIIPMWKSSVDTVDFIAFPGNNFFLLGKISVVGDPSLPIGAMMTTEEAWNLDTKVDDGLPYGGFIQTFYRAGSTQWGAQETNACANSAAIQGATYNFNRTGLSCSFRITFN